MSVFIGAAEFDALASPVNVGWCEFDATATHDVRIGWCELDVSSPVDVRVGWCEFDAASTHQVLIGWAEFDCLFPGNSTITSYFGNGNRFPGNIEKFEIPLTIGEDEDEEAVVITLLMEIAKHAFL